MNIVAYEFVAQFDMLSTMAKGAFIICIIFMKNDSKRIAGNCWIKRKYGKYFNSFVDIVRRINESIKHAIEV